MLYRLRRNLKMWIFNRQIEAVMETPPIVIVEAPWTIVSMVKDSDISMYLLALKSFYLRICRGKVLVIIDRDLSSRSRALLERHVPGVRLVVLEDIETGACQRGGTWERLVFLVDHCAREYCIQLDADTLSFGPDLSEIVACIEQNVSFTMSDGLVLQTMRRAAEEARSTPGNYVGLVAERTLDRYPDCDSKLYVRGSSGLAGFAKGGFSRGQLENFHRTMQGLIGPRWREWGTEQCGSNFAVANSPDAKVLPNRVYASFNNNGSVGSSTKFLHFIGSHRFNDGFYAAQGRKEIDALMASRTAPARGEPGGGPG